MKNFSFLIYAIVLLTFACNTSGDNNEINSPELLDQKDPLVIENGYDSLLAKRLGGDEYGMKKYVLAFLKVGSNKPETKEEAQKLQIAHMENIQRLAAEGKLVVAGPFMDNGIHRGIYVFNVETLEEAQELCNTDPAIQAGILELEMHPWYCSAALVDVNNIHNRIMKKNITD